MPKALYEFSNAGGTQVFTGFSTQGDHEMARFTQELSLGSHTRLLNGLSGATMNFVVIATETFACVEYYYDLALCLRIMDGAGSDPNRYYRLDTASTQFLPDDVLDEIVLLPTEIRLSDFQAVDENTKYYKYVSLSSLEFTIEVQWNNASFEAFRYQVYGGHIPVEGTGKVLRSGVYTDKGALVAARSMNSLILSPLQADKYFLSENFTLNSRVTSLENAVSTIIETAGLSNLQNRYVSR